jgi:hypothetical protein
MSQHRLKLDITLGAAKKKKRNLFFIHRLSLLEKDARKSAIPSFAAFTFPSRSTKLLESVIHGRICAQVAQPVAMQKINTSRQTRSNVPAARTLAIHLRLKAGRRLYATATTDELSRSRCRA